MSSKSEKAPWPSGRVARPSLPRALREQVWLETCGARFSAQCAVPWCSNRMTCFDFHVAHRQARARGGSDSLENLVAMCARCNLSMGTESFASWAARASRTSQVSSLGW